MYSLFNKELSVRSVSGGMRVPFRLFEGGADEHPLGYVSIGPAAYRNDHGDGRLIMECVQLVHENG